MAGFLRSIGIKLKSYGLFIYTRKMVATHVNNCEGSLSMKLHEAPQVTKIQKWTSNQSKESKRKGWFEIRQEVCENFEYLSYDDFPVAMPRTEDRLSIPSDVTRTCATCVKRTKTKTEKQGFWGTNFLSFIPLINLHFELLHAHFKYKCLPVAKRSFTNL